MSVKFGQAAILAAMMTLLGDAVWAQTCPRSSCTPLDCCTKAKCGDAKDCCAAGECCKEGKCCKDKPCGENCSCCKDNKCECGKGGECCCGKSGKCVCKDKSGCGCKAKNCCKGMGCGCCTVGGKQTKHVAIIVVMPSAMPMFANRFEPMGMMPHPLPPMGPHVMMPAPMPPLPPPPGLMAPPLPPQTVGVPIPPPACCAGPMTPCIPMTPCVSAPPSKMSLDTCLSLLNLAGDLCAGMRPLNLPSLCASAMGMMVEPCPLAYVQAPTLPMPQYLPSTPPLLTVREPNAPEAANSYACGVGGSYDCGAARTTVQACEPIGYEAIKHANIPNFRISAKPSSQKLEMKVGDHACLNCVKMSVKIGDNEIKLTRFDDRVRVRGEELKATADCIRSEEKDCLILEGDVVLHYKKDGHSANVTGDCIEMNLSSGAVTIKPAAKVSSCPSVRINRVEGYYSK